MTLLAVTTLKLNNKKEESQYLRNHLEKREEVEMKEVAPLEAEKMALMKNSLYLGVVLSQIMNKIRDLMKRENLFIVVTLTGNRNQDFLHKI